MFLEIDHFGIIVRDIKEHYNAHMSHLFPRGSLGEIIHDPIQKVRVAFIRVAGGSLELIEPASDDSPISRLLIKSPAGYHHTCIKVKDIDEAIQICKEKRQIIISPPKPAIAFAGKKIAFVMGKDRLLWELLES